MANGGFAFMWDDVEKYCIAHICVCDEYEEML